MTEEDINDYNIDDVIEKLFEWYLNKDNVLYQRQVDEQTIFQALDGKKERAFIKLFAYDIITENNGKYTLTKEGYKVIRLGGWYSYLKHLNDIEQQAEKDRQLAIEVNESVKRTNLNQVRILWATVFVSILSLLISWLSYLKKDENELYLLPKQQILSPDTMKLKQVFFPKIKCRHNMDTFCCKDTPYYYYYQYRQE